MQACKFIITLSSFQILFSKQLLLNVDVAYIQERLQTYWPARIDLLKLFRLTTTLFSS